MGGVWEDWLAALVHAGYETVPASALQQEPRVKGAGHTCGQYSNQLMGRPTAEPLCSSPPLLKHAGTQDVAAEGVSVALGHLPLWALHNSPVRPALQSRANQYHLCHRTGPGRRARRRQCPHALMSQAHGQQKTWSARQLGCFPGMASQTSAFRDRNLCSPPHPELEFS